MELLGIDLATIRELTANVEPYLRALSGNYAPRRSAGAWGGYIDRRCTAATGNNGLCSRSE